MTGSGSAATATPDGNPQHWADLLDLTIDRLARPVEGIHRAVIGPWLNLAGPRVQQVHNAFIGGIHTLLRLAAPVARITTGALALSSRDAGQGGQLESSSLGTAAQAIANALWGDELERQGNAARIDMGLRDADRGRIPTDRVALNRSFPKATGRIVVLLHGLGQTECCWAGQANNAESATGLRDVLACNGFTPLLVRYNSGRRVSDNGKELAHLLEEIARNWPVPVGQVDLVGYSMGGLVARSSVYAGQSADHQWTQMVHHLVTLGAPHLGSPLEKGANLISQGLGLATQTQPLRDFLELRSEGIKDLRRGTIRSGQLGGDEPGSLRGVEQHFLAGVVTTRSSHPAGRLVGDLVVRVGSATGNGHRRRVEATDVRIMEGKRHFDLFHDSTVHDQVRDWLLEASPGHG